MAMADDIVALLQLFQGHVPDHETNALVLELASNSYNWPDAHDLFDGVRRLNLAAIKARDRVRECQYCFEEVCLQSLYNETHTDAPFDSDSPHWIIKNAIALARAVKIPVKDVLAVVAPDA